MSSFGCENNSLKGWIESTPSPSKLKLSFELYQQQREQQQLEVGNVARRWYRYVGDADGVVVVGEAKARKLVALPRIQLLNVNCKDVYCVHFYRTRTPCSTKNATSKVIFCATIPP